MTTQRKQLVLSLFPGIDLFGRGFEEEGYAVVRGPDTLTGGDIRGFSVPPGRFDGVIGGPPCQDFSKLRRTPPSGYGLLMLAEWKRIIEESRPHWWLMENVPGVPDMKIQGYCWQRLNICASECGAAQSRLRCFQWGCLEPLQLAPERHATSGHIARCVTASEGRSGSRRSWEEFVAAQGLPVGFDLPGFSVSGKYRAVGNGVPLPMARTMARAVQCALVGHTPACLCPCGCGRYLVGSHRAATASCRKRLERSRHDTGLKPSETPEPTLF